jgi:UDP-N-acetylmuramyl pentapeptide synthase
VAFVGVTGSAGKTTTKELVAAILGSGARGRRSPGEANDLATVAKTVLRTTRRDRWCVVEVAAGRRVGLLARKAQVLRPTIAVVTNVGQDHRTIFRTLEATAAEKRALLEHAVPDGTAVLNADDPLVMAMADGFPGRVLTYGSAAGAALRAEAVHSVWPQPLRFTARFAGEAVQVQTRLLGRHWITVVLAAMGAALAAGVTLGAASEAVAAVDPLPGRMRPVRVGAVTFIDDALKAPLWALESTFGFLAEARAERKILVMGTISDYPGSASATYRRAARRALEVADEVIFVGPNAPRVLGTSSLRAAETLRTSPSARAAAQLLGGMLRPGDLVVLKGSGEADHLERILGWVV